jgi:hypothetical protein
MSVAAHSVQVSDQDLVQGVFERIAADLGMIIDRTITVKSIEVGRQKKRVEGKGSIHLSFKLAFKVGEGTQCGCVLIPLPDAIALAAYLMMVPDDAVQSQRDATQLDQTTKDSMMEVGNFISGATDAIVRSRFPEGYAVRSAGCQGVRPDVRPAFAYVEGTNLVVGRAQAQIHTFPAFELIAMLPAISMPGLPRHR